MDPLSNIPLGIKSDTPALATPQNPAPPIAPVAKIEPVVSARVMPSKTKTGAGPIIGALLIVILLAVGALYFWGAHLNGLESREQLPLIPGDATQQ